MAQLVGYWANSHLFSPVLGLVVFFAASATGSFCPSGSLALVALDNHSV
jgi:hypothetical protein